MRILISKFPRSGWWPSGIPKYKDNPAMIEGAVPNMQLLHEERQVLISSLINEGHEVVELDFPEELDGKNGIKIKDKTKWKEIVDDLIKNKEKRRAIGKEAKRYVLNNYDIKDHAYKWEEVYKTL